MAKSSAKVNPEVLQWARESLALDIGIAAKRIGAKPEQLRDWESGAPVPVGKLKKASEVYKRPAALFFLPSVPEDIAPIPDFRKIPESLGNPLSSKARLQIRKIYNKQQAAKDLFGPAKRWNLSGYASMDTSPDDVASQIRRNILGGFEQKWTSEYDAFNARRRAIESSGVLVFLITGVTIGEIRGFSVNDEFCPVIALNRADRPKPRSFTMMHEFCHLMLGQSGLCDLNYDDLISDNPSKRIETFCNRVAASVLLPKDQFLNSQSVRDHGDSPKWQQWELLSLSNEFMASQHAVLLRLLQFGRTTQAFYDKWSKELSREKKTGSVPKEKSFHRALRTQGETYVRLVLEALHNNVITVSRASDYLDMKVQYLPELELALAQREG